jgi:hypothetical protein
MFSPSLYLSLVLTRAGHLQAGLARLVRAWAVATARGWPRHDTVDVSAGPPRARARAGPGARMAIYRHMWGTRCMQIFDDQDGAKCDFTFAWQPGSTPSVS